MQHWAMAEWTEDGHYISESHAMLHVLGADCPCNDYGVEPEYTWITCKYGNWCTVEPEGWCAQCEDEFSSRNMTDEEWEEMLAEQEQYVSCGHDHLEGHRCGEEADYTE